MAFAFDCSFRDVEWPYRVAGAGCAAVSRRALSVWLRRRAGGGGEILPQDNADGPVDRARNRCDRFGRTRMGDRQDSMDLCAPRFVDADVPTFAARERPSPRSR